MKEKKELKDVLELSQNPKKENESLFNEEYASKIDSELQNEEEVKEKEELTDEEKHELFVKQLKEANKTFRPLKHIGNKTINKFDRSYKNKRNKKNRMTKKSRKANR